MPKTIFGASGPTISGSDVLTYICGSNAISRTMTVVSDYRNKGNGSLNKYIEAGHHCYFNINYESVRKSGAGDKVPNPFPRDLDKYKKDITPIFEYYSNHPNKDKIIWVCENEPTTKGFHSGPMSDYIAMLKVFCLVGKSMGYTQMIDGAVHVDRVNSIKSISGSAAEAKAELEEGHQEHKGYKIQFNEEEDADTPHPFRIPHTDMFLTSYSSIEEYRGSSNEVAQLLAGYRDTPDLWRVNLHTANIGGDFDSAKIKKATDKVQQFTGKQSLSNEWHVENTNNAELVQKIAKGWADAGVEYSVYLSGSGGNDIDLNNGMNLTAFGTAYRNFIFAHKAEGVTP